MGPVFVVVGHEHLEHTLKVCLVQNEQPVETFRANGAHEPLGHAIGLWGAERRANDFDPVTPEHVIKLGGELRSRSRIRKRTGSGRHANVQVSWRARWMTHGVPGCGVHPARCTRRLPNSMKKRT